MASVGVAPTSGLRESSSNAVDRLPEEMNDMRIRDDKVGPFVSCFWLYGFDPLVISC